MSRTKFLIILLAIAPTAARAFEESPLPLHSETLETQTVRPLPLLKEGADPTPFQAWNPTLKRQRLWITDGKTSAYDHVANRNEYGFRVTHHNQGPFKQHLIFVGCSLTFGQGTTDDATIPSLVAQANPGTHVYNLARIAGDPGDAAWLWSTFNLTGMIPEAQGTMVWMHAFHHNERVWPAWNWIPAMGGKFPRFDNSTPPQYIGMAEAQTDWAIVKWLQEKNLLEWFLRAAHHFRFYGQAEGVSKEVALLKLAKDAYLKQFPHGRFVVVSGPIFPAAHDTVDRQDYLEAFQTAGIEFFDLHSTYPLPPRDAQMVVPRDYHFTDYSNRYTAKAVMTVVELRTSR